jgi:ectoine hydroxylase-related dioxygenase (phytanoyl-CoA dioxygenase family)
VDVEVGRAALSAAGARLTAAPASADERAGGDDGDDERSDPHSDKPRPKGREERPRRKAEVTSGATFDDGATKLAAMSFDVETAAAKFRADGFVILERAIDSAAVDALVTALSPFERARPMGRNDFEGERTQRVYSLAAKGAPFLALAEHPWIVALLDRLLLPNCLLSTLQSIRLHPGETAQAWHTDDAFYLFPRPRTVRLAVSVIWAIEEFDEARGATEVIPGSHLWGSEHPDERGHVAVPALMPAGSAIVFDGALWHRGGANRSEQTRLAVSPQYCQPFLRPQESQLLIVPPEHARATSDRMRSMLGYSIHPPFVGQVDGMHPLRLVDEEYRTRKTEDHAIADRVLARPTSVFDEH